MENRLGKHRTHSWEDYRSPPQMLWFAVYAILCNAFHWISDDILSMKDYYSSPLRCLLHYIPEPNMIAPIAKTAILQYTSIGCQIFYLRWRIVITHLGGDIRAGVQASSKLSNGSLILFFRQKMTWKRWDDLLWPALRKISMPHGNCGSCLNCNYGSHWGGRH